MVVKSTCLLLVLLVATLLLLGSCSLTLALDTARATSAVWRRKSEVDVLLGIKTNDERWNIDDLLANTVQRTWSTQISELNWV